MAAAAAAAALAAAALARRAVLLPLVYLVVRAVAGGGDALGRPDARAARLELVLDTGVLVGAVTAAAIAIGVPLAWLVDAHRPAGPSGLRGGSALPLVIPSYVAALALLGAFGPKGLLQRRSKGRSASSGCRRSTASPGRSSP